MELKELPEAMQEAFKSLRFNSASIECDVQDALESAENLDDFQNRVSDAMDSLIAEAQGTKAVLCEKDEPVVLDASRFLEWINSSRRMAMDFSILEKCETLWDIPDIILPKHVFISGFETACKYLSHDLNIVRIADQSTINIPVTWVNIPPKHKALEAAA